VSWSRNNAQRVKQGTREGVPRLKAKSSTLAASGSLLVCRRVTKPSDERRNEQLPSYSKNFTESKSDRSIVDVIQAAGIALRRRGRELVGLCPFHQDNHASMGVSPEKNVWYCFTCGIGGDAIEFIKRLHGVDFREALEILNIEKSPSKKRPTITTEQRRRNEIVRLWCAIHYRKCGALCRQISRQIAATTDAQVIDGSERQFEILSDLHEDLATPALAHELFESRQFIEEITKDAPTEPLEQFPEITPEYQAYLRKVLP
jgi:hypothetical protein